MNLWERQSKHFEESKIIEVYNDNFIYEMNQLSKLIEEGFNFIGIDTEFPGIIFFPKFEEKYKLFFSESIKNNSEIIKNYNYDTIRLNVEHLKLIQIGLCLYNPNKNEKRTWQFNLNFNIIEEKYSNSSIELLQKSGINFAKMKEEGINYNLFSKIFISSGLISNKNITWVTFHGNYDLAYLIRLLTNESLPIDEKKFMENISIIFPNFYDIKYMLRNSSYKNFGLKKISKCLNLSNDFISHLAGNDSLITIEVLFNLIQRNFFNKNFLQDNKNILWGLGAEFDSTKILEYLLKNQIFYTYYYTNYYFMITNGTRFNNMQVNYITEKKRKNYTYYGV